MATGLSGHRHRKLATHEPTPLQANALVQSLQADVRGFTYTAKPHVRAGLREPSDALLAPHSDNMKRGHPDLGHNCAASAMQASRISPSLAGLRKVRSESSDFLESPSRAPGTGTTSTSWCSRTAEALPQVTCGHLGLLLAVAVVLQAFDGMEAQRRTKALQHPV